VTEPWAPRRSAAKGKIEHLDIPARTYGWRPKAPNPYASVLQLADALVVTSDNASMLAEACYSGKSTETRSAQDYPERVSFTKTARKKV